MSHPDDLTAAVSDVYQPRLTTNDLFVRLEAESGELLSVVEKSATGKPIPFCAGWTVGDLVTHVAQVYRWVSLIVGEGRTAPPSRDGFAALADPDPADTAGMVSRLERARSGLLDAFISAPAEMNCWTLWPAPANREFWVRRMLHESVVHRIDVDNAGRDQYVSGENLDVDLAVDGVDEMICGFAQRYSRRLRDQNPTTLAVTCAETGSRWWASIGPDVPEFGRGGPADSAGTEVVAKSGELLLLLWNRRTATGLTVSGDLRALASWAAHANLD